MWISRELRGPKRDTGRLFKILLADKMADPDRRRRFVQEAKTASALNHAGIVTIHDITQRDGIDFIVMEFVPGVLETVRSVALGVGQNLSWSADSRILVVGASPSAAREVLTAVMWRLERRITTPPPATFGDSLPSVSPDGRTLAFVRRSGVPTGEL